MKNLRILAAASLLAAFSLPLPAQEAPLYERGATYSEYTMPPSPGPASVVKYADVPFSHSAGLAEYDVPFYTLEGRELSIPIGLHYASGGIKLDEIAGVAGLGWTLEAGGCITRTVMDMPDEFTRGSFRHEMPSDDLLSDLESQVENDDTKDYLHKILWRQVESSLDRYSYNVCGLKGSFVIQDDGTVFQFGGDGVKIEYSLASDGSVDSFTLTGPDGTVYILSEKEVATHRGRNSSSYNPSDDEHDRWSATTAWHLSSMHSCNGLETASFTYSEPENWENVVYPSCQTVDVTCGSTTSTSTGRYSTYIYYSYTTKVLTGISLNGYNASFTYSTDTGYTNRASSFDEQYNFPFMLTGISVCTSGNSSELARIEVETDRASLDGRIILNGLNLYKGGELDDTWNFSYNSVDSVVSRGSQDWYGYYNGENEYSTSGTAGICPYAYSQLSGFDLTNGFPDSSYADYMSLSAVEHDGARTSFSYRASLITVGDETYSVGVCVRHVMVQEGMNVIQVRRFTYDLPVASGPYVPSVYDYLTISMAARAENLTEACDWTYSLHETPVTIGPSLRDTRIYYGKVVEDVGNEFPLAGFVGNTIENTARTVCMYDTSGIGPDTWPVGDRFPLESKSYYQSLHLAPGFCSPWDCVAKEYNDSGHPITPVLIRKEVYAYEEDAYKLKSASDYTYDEGSRTSVLVGYNAYEVMTKGQFTGVFRFDYVYHFPVYASSWSGRNLIKATETNYHDSGTEVVEREMSYVPRSDMSMPPRVDSISTNVAGVKRTISYVYPDTWNGDDLWAYALSTRHNLSVPLKKTMQYRYPSFPTRVVYKEETNNYDWVSIDGTSRLLPISHKEMTLGEESWSETVLSRDCKGNISSFKEKGHPETVVLWSYNGRYPVAVIENATISRIVAFMGGQSAVNGLTNAITPTQTHIATLAAMRRVLSDIQITTYSYLPGVGITSMTDPAGVTTTYEYDHAGRLVCVRDNEGNKMEEYTYSLMTDENGRKHMRSKVYRSEDGQEYSEDVRWWDKYGRLLEDISIAASGDGRDLVTAFNSDFLFHDDIKTWLPYPTLSDNGDFQSGADAAAAEYHGNDKAFLYKDYEISARDKVVATALPGYADVHETTYDTDLAEDFPILQWTGDSIYVNGTYDYDSIITEIVTDADGRVKSVFKDHTGRILGTSNGSDDPTYYVYDKYDRLRAVAGSGIELTDTLNMWRYDYDSQGRLASKGLPSSIREYYEYDDEDRVISVQRGGLLKEYEYDAFGRVLNVYHTNSNASRVLYENHQYDTYPDGMSGSNPKGLVTSSQLAEISPDGTVSGYVRIDYSYDDRHRVIKTVYHYPDGSELIEDVEYKFAGEAASKVYTHRHGTAEDVLTCSYTYDIRGRVLSETATLSLAGGVARTGIQTYSYDDMGRVSVIRSYTPGGSELQTDKTYTLQGWLSSLNVTYNNLQLFTQNLGYDEEENITAYEPQYSGYVALKEEAWFSPEAASVTESRVYKYDYAGRLSTEKEGVIGLAYKYDARGNVLSVTNTPRRNTYTYSGDRLISLKQVSIGMVTSTFSYDSLGRMTHDGLNGLYMEYNCLDLVRKVSRDSTILVKYSYLADGTKLSALNGNGEGLVYRGPFVYRQSSGGEGNSSLTLESASFSGGLLTPGNVLLYVRDYLGSVRAVVDAETGALYKAVDYSAFGNESGVTGMQLASLPSGMTLRDGYTSKEDQSLDFGAAYIDFGARQYSPALNRWLVPDPLSEKFYGISPYAFCNSNPVNYVDVDGEFPDIIWDIASIGMGAKSLVDNVRAGNARAAIGDGVGIVIDAVAAAVPFVPGGVGALRTGAKLVDVADDVVDAARGANRAENVTKAPSRAIDSKLYVTYTKKNPVTGEVYSGRTSGYGDPRKIVAKRDSGHHMNKKGFGEAQIDRVSTDPDAIRGREQYLIDLHGGAKSQGGTSGNAINGISQTNPNKQRYVDACEREYGWQH